ncbi:hypothetical protein FH972_026578 [Carpinus fangiana]|uniref:FAD dependent oxidoreductase domain-containing protein n=1 Tax=Carpinus fangiana TaxID=176857 RepID=A0A5N6L4S9_9ROSI|nr:hypothetical protein FH972_026578 [Carpinus fangiana]
MAQTVNVVVLGAGVSGLTTAYELSKNKQYSITVIAKHMPGDYDIEYASPWAGANYLPVHGKDTEGAQFEKDTWPALERLARHVPGAGVHFQDAVLYNRDKDANSSTGLWFKELLSKNPWYKDVVPNFRTYGSEELPDGVDNAQVFTSVCINTAIYLPWLVSQGLQNGNVYRRGIVHHINDAADLHHSGKKASVVINCTGLGALKLGGVEDTKMYPARGQIVVVRNDPKVMMSISGTDDGGDELVYMMHRAAGGGCVLGGCYQKHNWESQADPNLATRIMKRCVELCPDLTGGKGIEALSVIRHAVGLRPVRDGGIRVAKEKVGDLWVVHNYGHGGGGYQCSYGCTKAAVQLVEEAVQKGASRARL